MGRGIQAGALGPQDPHLCCMLGWFAGAAREHALPSCPHGILICMRWALDCVLLCRIGIVGGTASRCLLVRLLVFNAVPQGKCLALPGRASANKTRQLPHRRVAHAPRSSSTDGCGCAVTHEQGPTCVPTEPFSLLTIVILLVESENPEAIGEWWPSTSEGRRTYATNTSMLVVMMY